MTIVVHSWLNPAAWHAQEGTMSKSESDAKAEREEHKLTDIKAGPLPRSRHS